MNTAQFLTHAWIWNPLAAGCTALALMVYTRLFGWSRRAWWMIAAAATFLLTLCSPLGALADGYLFSAHMLQHIVLVLAVPALALLALPPGPQLPRKWARLLNPLVCWACGVGAMWVWHVPALCDAAVASRPVSALQTVTLLGLGAAFWWQMLAPCESQRIAPLTAIVYLFTACTACTVLGVMLTFSPVTVCRAYLHPVDRLGIAGADRGSVGDDAAAGSAGGRAADVGADVPGVRVRDLWAIDAVVYGAGGTGGSGAFMNPMDPETKPNWKRLPHERMPQPTYFPAGAAMGVAFFFWGLITSWVVIAVGTGLFTAAFAGWIMDIRDERKRH